MQTLQFEQAWDKTVSAQDRALITEIFEQTKSDVKDRIDNVLIRAARNHRGDLLLTVLIHNFTEQLLAFDQTSIHCHTEQHTFSGDFTIPALRIPAESSMPWTFIFKEVPDIAFQDIIVHINY